MRLPLCIVLATFLTNTSFAQQSTPLFMERDNVYHIADSIRQELVADGVDTLILHYRSRYWHPIKTSDGMYQEKTAFLLWVRGKKVTYQWMGPRADYKAKTEYLRESNYGHLFAYYITHKAEVDNAPVTFASQYAQNEPGPLEKKTTEDMDYSVFTYQLGTTTRTEDWLTEPLRFETNARGFDRFNNPLYRWIEMVEAAFRNALDERWTPENMKEVPAQAFMDFEKGMKSIADARKKREAEFAKYHKFEKQEFEIPASVRGLVTIIQKAECGERLKIKNKTRVVRIPSSGVLTLKENYIDFYKELFMEKDRVGTTFYQVDGETRTVIPVLSIPAFSADAKDYPAVYMQLQSSHRDENGEYTIITFFVGTYAELQKFDYGHLNVDKAAVVEALKKCK